MNAEKALIIVTGSSGLIGRSFITRAADRLRVVGFDREGYPHPPPEAECAAARAASQYALRP